VLSLTLIAVFDIGGPLAAYALLRSSGLSAVTALVLSGILPAFGVLISFLRDRRLDAIGTLALLGIAVGTVLGLVSGNPRLVLVEGSVPTAVFGLVCLASLWSRRPLIYRFALAFTGPGTPRGRDFESGWQYDEFRRVFRVITIVWGVAYLTEAAARVIIVESTSTGAALAISKVMPYSVAAVLVGWTWLYGERSRRRGERLGAPGPAPAPAPAATAAAQEAEPAETTPERPPVADAPDIGNVQARPAADGHD
jgi:hypothetical protein